MNDLEQVRAALELAIRELEEVADFIGSDGYFTRAKGIHIDVLPVLREALAALSSGEATDTPS